MTDKTKRINPKSHDSMFKWLISAFTEDFFKHYFPEIKIGEYTFFDKEFIRKYDALKESLKGDLLLMMEVNVDGVLKEIVIQIEHQSERKDVAERVFEYSCYAWLLKKKPVWSMVIYTDDAVWRKPVPDRFWFAYNQGKGKQFCHFDVKFLRLRLNRIRILRIKSSIAVSYDEAVLSSLLTVSLSKAPPDIIFPKFRSGLRLYLRLYLRLCLRLYLRLCPD